MATEHTAITLTKNGRFETVVGNFGGATNSFRLYGCDGVIAFEFDGTNLSINTGMSSITRNTSQYTNHIYLSFGASLQFSSLGNLFNGLQYLAQVNSR